MNALARALRMRRQTRADAGSEIVVPLRGGSAALLPKRFMRRLVTSATRIDGERPSPGITGLLERLQARRSSLLLVPDRPTGVAIALRWRISPEKFRLENDYRVGHPQRGVETDGVARPWHAR